MTDSQKPKFDVNEIPEEARALLESRFSRGFTVRDEANAITAWAFRNGPLEDLHAGVHSELLESPRNSRITDDEMRSLMIHAADRVEALLLLKEQNPQRYRLTLMGYAMMYCGEWER